MAPLPAHGREVAIETRHISNPSWGPPTLYWVAIDDDDQAIAALKKLKGFTPDDDQRIYVTETTITAHAMDVVGMTEHGEILERPQQP